MSVVILTVDEVTRMLTSDGQSPFVVNDKEVDIIRFALNTGFTDIVLDEYSALRVMYQRPGETEVRAQTLTYYNTDGLRNYYDWQLLSADLAKKGTLTVALCILRTDSEVEEWHTTPCQVRVLDSIHTDDSDEADETITPTVAERVAVLESMIQRVASGAPIVVASTSEMTDTEQIYVLSTDGMWYYYDGSAWIAGGTYGAVATDTTLTQSGVPADAKAVGDVLSGIGGSDLIPTPATGALLHDWDLTQGLTDSVGSAVVTLHNATQGASGLTIASSSAYAEFPDVWGKNRIIEVDVADFTKGVSGTGNARLLTFISGTGTVYDKGFIYRGQTSNWDWYYPSWVGFSSGKSPDAISGKTIRLVIADDYTTAVYFGSDIVGITNKAVLRLMQMVVLWESGQVNIPHIHALSQA